MTVNLYAAARAAAGCSRVVVPAGGLDSVLSNAVAATRPELGSVLESCSFLLDGLAVHGDPAAINVPAGHEVDVLPPFAGG